MKKYAIISVSDKTNLIEFSKGLTDNGYEILATGNTAKLLLENSIECIEISKFTGFPEIFDGRVKTLQPEIFGGILMRRDITEDQKQAEENGIVPIDIVCVNLYPFPQVVNREDLSLEVKIENIDIGGPSLIRAAAKNYKYVSVLTDPSQYAQFIEELNRGQISEDTRKNLAGAAFSYTSYYDTLIANYLEKTFEVPKTHFRLNYKLDQHLRYGENPHQEAYIFGNPGEYFDVIHGKELSYNNIIDLVAAADLVEELEKNSCAIIKHTNPCGAATGRDIYEAYIKALSGDPVSAFGGIVAFNSIVDGKTADKLNEIFLEIICAPGYTEDALEILMKKKNRRIVKLLKSTLEDNISFRNIPGGVIAQDKDLSRLSIEKTTTVTKATIDEKQYKDMQFAWVICKHTKSNAIVFAKDRKILGVGAGQMSRVDSVKLAASKAKEHGHELNGAVAASDAFFPFADGLLEIVANGINCVIQPGGSVRDEDVIKAADEHNVAMIFTGIRNFKH